MVQHKAHKGEYRKRGHKAHLLTMAIFNVLWLDGWDLIGMRDACMNRDQARRLDWMADIAPSCYVDIPPPPFKDSYAACYGNSLLEHRLILLICLRGHI